MFSYINIKEVTVKSVFYLGSPRLKSKKSPKGLPLSIPIQIFLDKPTPNLKTPVDSSVNKVHLRHNIHSNPSTHTILSPRLDLYVYIYITTFLQLQIWISQPLLAFFINICGNFTEKLAFFHDIIIEIETLEHKESKNTIAIKIHGPQVPQFQFQFHYSSIETQGILF